MSLDAQDWARWVVIVPAIFIIYRLKVVVTIYKHSLLKQIGLSNYVAAIILSGVQVAVSIYAPEYGILVLYLFNFFGQVIAMTGVLESLQFIYVFVKLRHIRNTNRFFLKLWCLGLAVCLSLFVATNLGCIDLMSYRYLSFASIAIETIFHCVTISYLKKARRATVAKIYYSATILCRIGILVGLWLRISINVSALIIDIIHFGSVIGTGLSMLILTKIFSRTLQKSLQKYRENRASRLSRLSKGVPSRIPPRISTHKTSGNISKTHGNARVHSPTLPVSQRSPGSLLSPQESLFRFSSNFQFRSQMASSKPEHHDFALSFSCRHSKLQCPLANENSMWSSVTAFAASAARMRGMNTSLKQAVGLAERESQLSSSFNNNTGKDFDRMSFVKRNVRVVHGIEEASETKSPQARQAAAIGSKGSWSPPLDVSPKMADLMNSDVEAGENERNPLHNSYMNNNNTIPRIMQRLHSLSPLKAATKDALKAATKDAA